jgi:magnesium transporter
MTTRAASNGRLTPAAKPKDQAEAKTSGQPDSLAAVRSAEEHATRRVPTAAPGDLAGDVRAMLVACTFDYAGDVVVLEGRRLVGVLPIEELLAADGDRQIADLMDRNPQVVQAGAAQEEAVRRAIERSDSALAVVDESGSFLGMIPQRRMLAVMHAEHDEDVARIGGYMASTSRARQAAEEPLARRLWHRLPWLAVGLAGAMVSAVLVGAFEEQLSDKVLLAFFVPAVVYMADAVGTQTETVLIRGLAVGVGLKTVLRRELLTGGVIGLLVAAAFLPFALLAWGDVDLAVAVAVALFASCAVATVVAMALPVTLQRLGRDPAFGSGPLATVIQDLLSIAIYFAIAVPMAT